jgi:hypothetical protein
VRVEKKHTCERKITAGRVENSSPARSRELQQEIKINSLARGSILPERLEYASPAGGEKLPGD